MKELCALACLATLLLGCSFLTSDAPRFRQLPLKGYLDKMKAGWLGQMAGVGWGAPTEFKYRERVIPEERPKIAHRFGPVL